MRVSISTAAVIVSILFVLVPLLFLLVSAKMSDNKPEPDPQPPTHGYMRLTKSSENPRKDIEERDAAVRERRYKAELAYRSAEIKRLVDSYEEAKERKTRINSVYLDNANLDSFLLHLQTVRGTVGELMGINKRCSKWLESESLLLPELSNEYSTVRRLLAESSELIREQSKVYDDLDDKYHSLRIERLHSIADIEEELSFWQAQDRSAERHSKFYSNEQRQRIKQMLSACYSLLNKKIGTD